MMREGCESDESEWSEARGVPRSILLHYKPEGLHLSIPLQTLSDPCGTIIDMGERFLFTTEITENTEMRQERKERGGIHCRSDALLAFCIKKPRMPYESGQYTSDEGGYAA